MPIHDWTRVEAGIFHAFHHRWLTAISDALNGGVLPENYYALPEQIMGGLVPDILTLELGRGAAADGFIPEAGNGNTALLVAEPRLIPTDEASFDHYIAKRKGIVVRHVSHDRVVAIIEIVSPGNKSSEVALTDFLQKASELLKRGVHLLVVDVHPPTSRDPEGIHGAIWDYFSGRIYALPPGKRLTAVSYEADLGVRAYAQAMNVGDPIPDMPLFLRPNGCVQTPLESTYMSAFDHMPKRWKHVLQEF